jgi:hypothetical protein
MTTYSNAQVSQITPLPAGEHLAVLEGTGYNNTVCHTQGENILYQRSRFATQLPVSCRYTPSHFWLLEESAGVWRIGFTKLATWLLGGRCGIGGPGNWLGGGSQGPQHHLFRG